MNNCATIVKINAIQKHPNADRLQIISLFGTQVISDMDTKQDDLMIYFDSNLKLSNDYCKNNNLFRTKELNIDQTKSGYVDDNCRVKAIKLKGEFSDGILMPLNSLDFINKLNINELIQGFEFNDINGINICEKYIPVQQKSANKQGNNEKKNRGRKAPKSPMFVEHWDTSQFFKNQHVIPAQTILYLEEKIHGTSGRIGNALISRELNKFERLLKYFKVKISEFEWKYIHGSRRVTYIERSVKSESFHDNTMREETFNSVKGLLNKGEEIYFELYGYEKTNNGAKFIQKDFPYGCKPNEYKKLLYRVTMNNEDGKVIDCPREYVYTKADELGMNKPYVFEKYYYDGSEESMKILEDKVKNYALGQSELDKNTLKEGVVVWFINGKGFWTCLKYKQDAFRLKESSNKDKGIIDQEDLN